MRCYNTRCPNWKMTICEKVCGDRISNRNRAVALGLVDYARKTKLKRIGSSVGVVLPSAIVKEKQLRVGDEFAVSTEANKIVLNIPPLPLAEKSEETESAR